MIFKTKNSMLNWIHWKWQETRDDKTWDSSKYTSAINWIYRKWQAAPGDKT